MKRIKFIAAIMCVLAGYGSTVQAQDLVTPPAGLPEETWRLKYNDYRDVHNVEDVETLTPDKERLVTIVWDDDQLYVKGMFEAYPDSWIHATILWDKRIVFDVETLICRANLTVEGSKRVYAINGVEEYKYFNGDIIITFSSNYDHTAETDQFSHFMYSSCIYTLTEDGKSIESDAIFPAISRECSAFWHAAQDEDFYDFSGYKISDLPDLDVVTNLRFEQVTGADHSWDPNSHHAVPAILPLADLPQETWTMKYNNYWNWVAEGCNAPERSRERPVTFVWDDNTLYVKGIFYDYPQCWMMGTLKDNIVRFKNSQLICEEDLILNSISPVYAMAGGKGYFWHSGPGGYYESTEFINDYRCMDWAFELSDDGKTLEAADSKGSGDSGLDETSYSQAFFIIYNRKALHII